MDPGLRRGDGRLIGIVSPELLTHLFRNPSAIGTIFLKFTFVLQNLAGPSHGILPSIEEVAR